MPRLEIFEQIVAEIRSGVGILLGVCACDSPTLALFSLMDFDCLVYSVSQSVTRELVSL